MGRATGQATAGLAGAVWRRACPEHTRGRSTPAIRTFSVVDRPADADVGGVVVARGAQAEAAAGALAGVGDGDDVEEDDDEAALDDDEVSAEEDVDEPAEESAPEVEPFDSLVEAAVEDPEPFVPEPSERESLR